VAVALAVVKLKKGKKERRRIESIGMGEEREEQDVQGERG
jgi:hypothetical protein